MIRARVEFRDLIQVPPVRLTPHGPVIPALHDAANDAPIAYTPACARAAGVPVCLNPAYRRWLPDVTAALAPVLAQVAGLSGAPARATQVSEASAGPDVITLGGHPAVLRLSLGQLNVPGPCDFCRGPVTAKQFADRIRLLFAQSFVGAGQSAGRPVQQANGAVLLRGAGIPFAAQVRLMLTTENFAGPGSPCPGDPKQTCTAATATGPVYAAARRLATLPARARQAWLAAHLTALRAGRLTLSDLP